jgi:transposase
MSRQAAARRFGLAASTVIAWVRLFRQKGDVKPGQMGGHKPKAISGEYRTWLVGRCQVQDFTLRGLVSELAGRLESRLPFDVGIRARLRPDLQKKLFCPANKNVPTS